MVIMSENLVSYGKYKSFDVSTINDLSYLEIPN